MPAPRTDNVKVPAGEARGRFAISPEPNLTGADDHASSTAPGRTSGTAKDKDSGNAATVDAGSNRGAGATTTGRGGQGQVSGSAPGTSTVKGKNTFPGITILDSGAANGISVTGNPPPLQTSYGLTIVSTESSGGGLPQFGFFSNEEVYTVFVDMRRTVSDPAPSWTFEYAVLKGTASPTNAAASPTRSQQGVVLPFPVAKEQPVLAPEIARKYLGRRMIVSAVITTEGKVEQTAIKDSPDPALNEPVLTALKKWFFRPAQFDGQNVAAKALIGLPVFLPQ
jgi:hypothetical protein